MNKDTLASTFFEFKVKRSYYTIYNNCLLIVGYILAQLTRWLPTTSILVVIERIYRYRFKSNYLKNHKYFAAFFFFCISTLNFQCSEKKMSHIGQVFLTLLTPKDVLIYMHNRAWFWKPFGSERVNKLISKSKVLLNTSPESFLNVHCDYKLFLQENYRKSLFNKQFLPVIYG